MGEMSAGRADAAAASEGIMVTVLFACVHNAGRSQMAAAFFNQLADPARARAISAGIRPGEHVHPEVRAIRDQIRELVGDLLGREGWRAP